MQPSAVAEQQSAASLEAAAAAVAEAAGAVEAPGQGLNASVPTIGRLLKPGLGSQT